MSSFSWEYIYSFYRSYFLFHLQDFSDFLEVEKIHTSVQHVDLVHLEITVLDVAQDFRSYLIP